MTLQKKAANELKNYIERIEKIREDKAELNEDEKAIFAAAKSAGFDVKAMRRVIAMRKLEDQARLEFDSLVDTYCHALGMQLELELPQAAE